MRIVTRLCFLLVGFALLCIACTSNAQEIVVNFAPPELPVYDQPLCPEEGYIWTPGYWAFDNEFADYYWVPGTWVPAPEPGLFWTPPYWGWGGNGYAFYPGYWAPQVGYYGGIDYGYGYYGHGYEGGRWDNGRFYYNRAVNNINTENFHDVYDARVNERGANRVSYNGGEGGIEARPTSEEERVMHDRHIAPVQAQTRQVQEARGNQQLRASVNQGRPPIAATPKAGGFTEHEVVPAKEAGAPYHAPQQRTAAGAKPGAQPGPAQPGPDHAKSLPPHTVAPSPNPATTKQEQQYQKQQQQLTAKQNQEHQKLAQQQEQNHQREAQQQQREQQQAQQHQAQQQQQQRAAQQEQAQQKQTQQEEQQRAAQQQAAQARNQQMERQHQQQTQQMEQRHQQQSQQMEQRHAPPPTAKPQPAAKGEPAPQPEKH